MRKLLGFSLVFCLALALTSRADLRAIDAFPQCRFIVDARSKDQAAKSDLDNLQGPWLAVAMVLDGKELTKEKLKQATMFINGNCLRLEGSLDGELGWGGGDITLDPAKRPKGLLLDNTKITDAGLAHLAGLPKLQFLGLGGTKVTDEGFKNLRKSLPKLEVAR